MNKIIVMATRAVNLSFVTVPAASRLPSLAQVPTTSTRDYAYRGTRSQWAPDGIS